MHEDITSLGASLVAVSPQVAKYSERITRRHKLAFDVLADPGNRVAQTFGLGFSFSEELRRIYRETLRIDLAVFNGDESWSLPLPARFVVGSDGRIVAADADPDYTRRPEPSATLAVLRRVQSE